MADLSKIMLPDGTSYDIRDRQAIPFIIGTQTAATSRWTGVADTLPSLVSGQTIRYFLPFGYSTSDYLSYTPTGGSAASGEGLELTLADGTSTGSLPVFYSGVTRVTSHYGQGAVLTLTYIENAQIGAQTATGWWAHAQYYSNTNDTAYYLRYNNGKFIADSPIYRYQLIFQIDENRMTPLNNNSNAIDTSKTMLTDVEFDPLGHISYYSATATIAKDAFITNTYFWYSYAAIDARYTFNCGSTLVEQKPFYLKVSLQVNGKCKLANSTPWAQELPTTDDGYYYIMLGRTYSTYQIALYDYHPVFYHDGTRIRRYTGEVVATTTQSGLMSAADKTKLESLTGDDTKNTAGSTNSTSKLFLIGAESQATNPQTYSHTYVYETNGALSAKTLGVNAGTTANKVTMQWNATDESLDFVFA